MSDRAKVVPTAVDEEEALLGALILAPEMLLTVKPILTPEQFYVHKNRWIYQSLIRLHDERKAIDYLTLTNELESVGKLAEIGGAAEITRLLNGVPNSYHAETYANVINESFVRRQLLEIANNYAKLAYGEQWSLDKIQEKASLLLQDCFAGVASNDEIIYAAEAISRQYDRMNETVNGKYPGIPTGFIDLDYLLNGGARRGDFVIVAARPGMGKSALKLDIFLNNIMRKAKANDDTYDVFVSMEMPAADLSDRMIAKAGIPLSNIRSAKLEDTEYSLYIHTVEEQSNYKFIIVDVSSLRPDNLRSILAKITAKHQVENVFIDYLQLMTAHVRKGANRVEEVSVISRAIKNIAREFKIVVYAGAQLSRAVEQRAKKRPQLSDLRESGSIEQDSDIVIFIYRPEVYEEDPTKQNIAEIIVAKHRNGATGSINLIFRKHLAKFENATTKHIDLNGDNGKGKMPDRSMETLRDYTV